MAELSRPRVLMVTRNLPPMRGGMERLNQHIALELAKEFEVTTIGPSGCRQALSSDISVDEIVAKPLWRFMIAAARESVRVGRRWRPHVVLAGSGLTAPFAWLASKFARARMIVYVHGLDLIATHPIFRWCWRPFIRRADMCIANSAHTVALARSIGVAADRLVIVHPGVGLPTPPVGPNDFRERCGLGDRPLLLSVGRLIARKGLFEFVDAALPSVVAEFPDCCLVVLGDEAPDLLQGDSRGLGDRIRQRAAALGIAANLQFIGPQDDATLADAYRAADVHVFPVRDVPGDVEGFGMVAVEAAAHGLPTVAFAVGGVPDAVAEGVSGHLVAAQDYATLAAKLIDLLRARREAPLRESARKFAERFQWARFGEQLRENVSRTMAVT